MKYNRNEFLKLTALGIAGASTLATRRSFASPASSKKDEKLHLAIASYTFRDFSLDDTIKMTKRLGIDSIALKEMHMPLDSTAQELKKIAAKIKDAGLDLYGAGVIYMKSEDEVTRAFEYAKNAGLEMIIGVPNYELLDMVNNQVKEHDIKLAIHNHGPGDKLYSSPMDVYNKIKNLDKRIGFCIDIGHVQRIGQNPVAMIERFKDRLYDVHFKDVDKNTGDGVPLEIGHGIIDIPKVIKTLEKINYKEHVAFEYEKDGEDPMPGLAESVGYVRGIMAVV